MEALFPTLFWGNVIAFLFLIIYHGKNRVAKERKVSLCLIAARMCHAFYYFVAYGRTILPDWLSVNAGNTMLFIGFYFEAKAILRIIKENTHTVDRIQQFILLAAIITFNVLEGIMPSGGIRIATASFFVVALMALPEIRMLVSRDSSVFVRATALLYGIFLIMLLIRTGYGLQHPYAHILTSTVLNSLAFLCLLLQLMISLPAYALILKEYSDDALLLMATTDRLTGATNRHAFIDAASAIFKNCKFFHKSLAVMFIDIDYFKQVNDSYGHAFGDCVLARLAAIIDSCLRGTDLSCRYGGEEFVVLLPRADHATAQIVTARIMNEVRAARFEEHPDFTFSVSIGVSCGVPLQDQSIDSIIRAADEAMYQAKRAGRDQCVAC